MKIVGQGYAITMQPTETNEVESLNQLQDDIYHYTTKIILAAVAVMVAALAIIFGVNSLYHFQVGKLVAALIYSLVVAIPLLIIGVFNSRQREGRTQKSILITWAVLGVVWLLALVFANFESYDWKNFLKPWCNFYYLYGWHDSLAAITQISDYTPLYNYFLIIIAQFGSPTLCLYAIKYLSFLFSIGLAVVMELIICRIRQCRLNYLRLVCFLILPPILLEFTAWGQCDAIYTFFCLLAFYWALQHKSILCFISLGLAFALKLQFLFIVPILFVMLIIRDENGKKYLSWWWVWLAPLMYVVNLVPVFFGAKLWDLLLVYVGQSGEYFNVALSMNACNLSLLFNWLVGFKSRVVLMVAEIIFIVLALTAVIYLLVRAFMAQRRQPLTPTDLLRYATCFAMTMVYFMPHMHDRFFFIAMVLACIWAMVAPSKKNILIATMIGAALAMPTLIYLFNCVLTQATGLVKGFNFIGFVLNTFAIIWLLKFDEKNMTR